MITLLEYNIFTKKLFEGEYRNEYSHWVRTQCVYCIFFL